ncbi:hypothetical protein PRUPE_1G164900 [Prunus persica]|uniref:3'-5' exonuclease n=1 Tax=Prunus persica TaxID=3760 RepID=A0A251QYD2_PRUPE|nr:Werner Syndrome-like exonuclease [Prunus persica]ONI28848.1 hypothetical protein PRUPE_1G164900 [Prunus persica]ONI28849.1 hypothetical protein PRUPE_1G164900 [Prunus persica]ONI28850.1 hypothetical protein PRUPE_1G164900 [Prunus persica]ONI28851.1 hypothetical protein PRUPE_1G164900 [Prunus persica]ONI28852.1 hypothetical protein PRUPE_1G164900 [Prunus persica]
MEEKSQSLENKSKSKKTILSELELDDEPFTEEDLQAIEAAFEAATSSSLPKKRRPSPYDDSDGDDKTQQHHCRIARRRLPSSVLALQHPNAFSLSPCRQANIRMRYPVMKFGGQITYSRTAVQVEKAAMEVLKIIEAKEKQAGQTAVGFDIEWRPTFQRGVPPRKAAVMQICVDTSCCHVMHIVHSGIPQSLQLLLEDASILKVGLGIAGDSVKVFKDYNVSTKAVEDLKYLAKRKLGGGLQNWGLASLTEKLICKQLLKPNKIRLGNWEAKFLSKEQLEYAAIDAFTSWHLYEVLKSLPNAEKVTPDNQSEELQAVSS